MYDCISKDEIMSHEIILEIHIVVFERVEINYIKPMVKNEILWMTRLTNEYGSSRISLTQICSCKRAVEFKIITTMFF